MTFQNGIYTGFFASDDCKIEDMEALSASEADRDKMPRASSVEKKIPVYEVPAIQSDLDDYDKRRALMAEWAYIFGDGPGVLVLKQVYKDTAIIDQATSIFHEIIAEEKVKLGSSGDHFAKAGSNDRIWNSLQKMCEHSPDVFAKYFANPAFDAACEAWLGPNYQVTAQVNLVRPGGKAQTCHRDYHLGFQTEETCAQYPAHVHLLSPLMTLQGGIAHCDMPVESGPTKLLPYSQKYAEGYAAWRREDFQAHFEQNFVQLPLEKGDALFFNPALFHAAGDNTSENIERLVNLVQVGSAMGRTLENIDRVGMCKLLYPEIAKLHSENVLSPAELNASIAACAEGYPFPTNLDTDPPIGGLAPDSQSVLFHKALEEGWSSDRFTGELYAQIAKQRA